MLEFSSIIGRVFSKVINDNDKELLFIEPGMKSGFKLYHEQDCCEDVYISDICGNLADLENSPILQAEEVSYIMNEAEESGTWTFYKIATRKGYVTIRWNGQSNGYYSEAVTFTPL